MSERNERKTGKGDASKLVGARRNATAKGDGSHENGPKHKRTAGKDDAAKEFYPNVEVRGDLGEHDTLLSIDKARRLLGYEPDYGWRAGRK